MKKQSKFILSIKIKTILILGLFVSVPFFYNKSFVFADQAKDSSSSSGLTAKTASAQGYMLEDKMVFDEDLPQKFKIKLNQIDKQAYKAKMSVYLDHLYFTHLEQQAQKQKTDVKAVEEKLLQVPEPSEKEIKQWYDKHKAHIPYEFNLVKGQLSANLKREAQMNKKKEIIEKLKKQYKFSMASTAPKDLILSIDAEGFPVKGADQPSVTIHKFSDFYCGGCKAASKELDKLVKSKKYRDKVAIFYLTYPILGKEASKISAQSLCFHQQDKFWQFHDQAFAREDKPDQKFVNDLAKELEMDPAKLAECEQSLAPQQIKRAQELADSLGVSSTPTIFVNGVKVDFFEEKELSDYIDSLLADAK